jgi:hypothetical protein
MVRPGQRVCVQVHPDHTGDSVARGATVVVHALAVDGGEWLATHPRAALRDSWVIDPAHFDGLPDGHTRATVVEPPPPGRGGGTIPADPGPLAGLLTAHHAVAVPVARRPLTDYQAAALAGTGAR